MAEHISIASSSERREWTVASQSTPAMTVASSRSGRALAAPVVDLTLGDTPPDSLRTVEHIESSA